MAAVQDLQKKLADAIIAGNTPQMVKTCLTMAFYMGASDVHMEPGEKIVRVRFRIDGILREIIEYPSNIHSAVSSRIKIMSGMKIDELRKPQDGRMQILTEDHKQIELRVSTLPTLHSEKVTMRLQDKTKSIPELKDLGLMGYNYKAIQETIQNPNGITLVTGPTGSGKTTTLYSMLNILNSIEVNILTIEDPVEYEMPGLAQSQVHPDIGYDFFFGLRTALRQDPDIIMVGEIRDQETIETAIKAALTGHMVLSTIHTNSAASTLTRILDMGVKPYKITSSIKTIQAQRLIRKVCENCKEEYTAEPSVVDDIKKELEKLPPSDDFDRGLLGNIKLYRGKGCEKCENTGMKGRVGLFEVMLITREIQEMILAAKHEGEIEDFAISQGMTTLLQDGYMKCLLGITTLEEVYKVSND